MRRKYKNKGEKYIALTDRHLHVCNSLQDLQKETGLMIEESEMKRIDGHYIARLSDDDIDFLQDKKRMSNIPWASMLKKDMTLNYLMYVVIALEVINLIRG